MQICIVYVYTNIDFNLKKKILRIIIKYNNHIHT